MKRWAFFIAIFLAGLGVLWWIDRGSHRNPRPAEHGATPDGQSDPGALTKVPIKEGQAISFANSGSFMVDEFDKATGKLLYRITARDHTSLGDGVYHFDTLVGRFYVEGTDQLRMEVSAVSARAKLTTFPKIGFDPAYKVQLDGVVATQLEGSPFVPLTLRIPHVTGSIGDQSFSSDDPLDISGTGLVADGIGLSYTGAKRELKLLRNTHANLTLENGTLAKLSAAGGLTFTNLGDSGLTQARVVAHEHAHLTFEGANPLVLDADEVTLEALVERKPAMQLTPTRALAHGSVRLAPADGTFYGSDAELEFDAAGHPTKARFQGAPRVELVLRGGKNAPIAGVPNPKAAELPVQMLGAGPLEVALIGDEHFDFQGPATLILPTLAMDLIAQEKLSGTRRAGSEFGQLDASGNVEVHASGSTVTAPALTIERKLTADGRLAAGVTTQGRTHAVGPLDDGSTFDLVALNGLEFVHLPDSFRVPIARDVDLIVAGVKPFHAKAREVQDLDAKARSMVGIGSVFFESDKGTGTGERIVAKSKDSIEVIGAPGALAHCEFEQGTLDARSVDFGGDRLRAEGDASVAIGVEGSEYRLHSRWIEVRRTANGDGQDLSLEAGGEVVAHITDKKRELDFTSDYVHALAYSATPKLKAIESRGLEASGGVDFHVRGDETLDGKGERLELDADRSGRLFPAPQRRVEFGGHLPKDDLTFSMTAGLVRFSAQSLSADDPKIEIEGVEVPVGHSGAIAGGAPLHAVAGSMSVDPNSILFTDGVYVGQTATAETTWSLDSENLALTGTRTPDPAGGGRTRFNLSTMLAWGGFQARFADQVAGRGTTLLLDSDQNRLTLRGEPAEFDLDGWRVKTDWLELDLATGFWRSSKGSAVTLDDRSGSFEFRFASMEPMNGVDSRVEVVREPAFIDLASQRETHASWALFWLNEDRLARMSSSVLHRNEPEPPEVPKSEPKSAALRNGFVRRLQALPFLEWVHEAYFEGNIEVLEKGDRRIRADSMYLDLVDGHGWMRDFIFTMEAPFRAEAKHLKLHADWLSFSPDGTARANNAVVTSCEFDEPHYVVTLGSLRVKPRPSASARKAIAAGKQTGADATDGWDVRSKDNSVKIGEGPKIPVPQIAFPMDADFSVPVGSIAFGGIQGLSFGNLAKFGASLGLSFNAPLGWFSDQLGRALGNTSEEPRGGNNAEVKYLNSRGLLLSGRNSLEVPGVYKLVTRLSVVSDTGSDKGLIRVPESDRSTLRGWLHVEGRRLLGANEWIDLNLTQQSDAGVQSEYFEREYLRWEERETYLHWRKARGLDYWRATVETQLDDHRTEVVETPTVGYTRSRGPIARWWSRDVVYTSDTSAGYLKRVEPLAKSYNEAPFPDGLGEREVLRIDSTQRLEQVLHLDVADAHLVPFVEARATAWDRDQTDTQAPTRFTMNAGAALSTTFWRMYGDGDLHSLTPSIGLRSSFVDEENGGKPVQFDGVEDPQDGTFTELGLRSRWVKPRDLRRPDVEERFLDIEVREAYANHLADPMRKEGWQPLRVNAQWLTEIATIPFGVTHDARYELDNGQTDYSRSAVGVRPWSSLEVETSFNNARDLSGARLYSAWSLAARYDFSPKWQIEARETISTLSGSQLDSGFLLRRLGHDFVVELEYSFTAGEGGSSIGFTLKPMVLFREPRLGLLRNWKAAGN